MRCIARSGVTRFLLLVRGEPTDPAAVGRVLDIAEGQLSRELPLSMLVRRRGEWVRTDLPGTEAVESMLTQVIHQV